MMLHHGCKNVGVRNKEFSQIETEYSTGEYPTTALFGVVANDAEKRKPAANDGLPF